MHDCDPWVLQNMPKRPRGTTTKSCYLCACNMHNQVVDVQFDSVGKCCIANPPSLECMCQLVSAALVNWMAILTSCMVREQGMCSCSQTSRYYGRSGVLDGVTVLKYNSGMTVQLNSTTGIKLYMTIIMFTKFFATIHNISCKQQKAHYKSVIIVFMITSGCTLGRSLLTGS